MPYVSARYAPRIPIDPPGSPRQIVATDDQGQEWFLDENCGAGDWLRYIEEGGTIEEYDEAELQTGPTPKGRKKK